MNPLLRTCCCELREQHFQTAPCCCELREQHFRWANSLLRTMWAALQKVNLLLRTMWAALLFCRSRSSRLQSLRCCELCEQHHQRTNRCCELCEQHCKKRTSCCELCEQHFATVNPLLRTMWAAYNCRSQSSRLQEVRVRDYRNSTNFLASLNVNGYI